MTTYTAASFLASTRFLEIAGSEALKTLAKTHRTTKEAIKRDLPTSSRLQRQLTELVHAAAKESAARMNAAA